MLSRTTFFLASIVATAAFTACSSPYSDVYSFKKNSFKAPAPKTKAPVTAPSTVNPLQGAAPGTMPGDPSSTIPGIPGVPGTAPAPGIPGVDPAGAAPAPGATPAPIPGLSN